jgi:hypothetical protein
MLKIIFFLGQEFEAKVGTIRSGRTKDVFKLEAIG